MWFEYKCVLWSDCRVFAEQRSSRNIHTLLVLHSSIHPVTNLQGTSTRQHMVSLARTVRNIRRVGLREWWRQMQYIGDAKSGRLVGTDR